MIGDDPAIHRNQGGFGGVSFRDGPKDQTSGAQSRTGEPRDSGFGFSGHPGGYGSRYTLPFSASPISSSTLGSSIVAGMVQLSPSAIFLMVPRRILPERVFGSLPTVIASLKAATGPSFSRTRATISFSISAGLRITPAFSTRKPQGTSPLMASLMPSTAHSATSGCEARISSMPPVESLWPATLMMSSVRPITQT